MENPIVILDCNNLCYQAFFTMGNLSNEELPVGVIYGFLRRLATIAKKFNTKEFYFVFDSQRSYRKKIYPEYKAKRKTNPVENIEHLYNQISQLRMEVLPDLGFKNIFLAPSYESDDVIAYIVRNDNKRNYIIVSTDTDLWQLLNYHVSVYNFKEVLTRKWFMEYSGGLDPWFWGEVLAIKGCTSDNVKGVDGVGEKTALKYLRGELQTGKALLDINNNKELIQFNRQLVHLPFKGKKGIELEFRKDKTTRRKFDFIFDKFRFVSLLRDDQFYKYEIFWKS